jgi:hypothetical protein
VVVWLLLLLLLLLVCHHFLDDHLNVVFGDDLRSRVRKTSEEDE